MGKLFIHTTGKSVSDDVSALKYARPVIAVALAIIRTIRELSDNFFV